MGALAPILLAHLQDVQRDGRSPCFVDSVIAQHFRASNLEILDPVPHEALVNIHFTFVFLVLHQLIWAPQKPVHRICNGQTSCLTTQENKRKHEQDPRSIYYCTPFVKTAAIPYHTTHTNLILSGLWRTYMSTYTSQKIKVPRESLRILHFNVFQQLFWELDLGSPTARCKQGASALSANL